MLVPYDNAKPKSQEDVSNYYHSRARICVECAFGRWGISWKKLNFNLDNSVTILPAALRLHNFLIDYRESKQDINDRDRASAKAEFSSFERECTEFARLYPDELVGVFGDNVNNEETQVGRPPIEEKNLRVLGSSICDNMRNQFKRGGFKRVAFYKRNKNNDVVML